MANFGELRPMCAAMLTGWSATRLFREQRFRGVKSRRPAVNMRNRQRLRHEPRKARANQHAALSAREKSEESDETAAK